MPVTQLRHEGEILLVNLVAARSRGLAVLVIARAGSPLLAIPGDVAHRPAGGAHHVVGHIGLVLTLPRLVVSSAAVCAADSPLHDVHAVEVRRLRRAQEELRPVRARTGVCHGEDALARILGAEILVLKLLAVDGLPAGPVVVSEVAALAHEAWNHAMERALLVAKTHVASAENPEVLHGLRNHVSAEQHHDAASLLSLEGDVEVDAGALGGLTEQGVVLLLEHL